MVGTEDRKARSENLNLHSNRIVFYMLQHSCVADLLEQKGKLEEAENKLLSQTRSDQEQISKLQAELEKTRHAFAADLKKAQVITPCGFLSILLYVSRVSLVSVCFLVSEGDDHSPVRYKGSIVCM